MIRFLILLIYAAGYAFTFGFMQGEAKKYRSPDLLAHVLAAFFWPPFWTYVYFKAKRGF